MRYLLLSECCGYGSFAGRVTQETGGVGRGGGEEEGGVMRGR